MLLDFEVQRSTRRCAATDRPLEPGEECYSVLEVQGADVIRKDYGRDAWQGSPEGAFAWWRTRVPEPAAKKVKLAPNDVLLELFDHLVQQPEQADLCYVLSLLLIRRRVFRFETRPESLNAGPRDGVNEGTGETMSVYCPRRDASYRMPVAVPTARRIDEIQQQLSELLVAGAE